MSMTQDSAVLKNEMLHQALIDLDALVHEAAQQGRPIHETERAIWNWVLALGRGALQQFLDLQGSGDLGETIELPDGRSCQRLPELHSRRYVSIFGEFVLLRTVYGSREGQKIDFVPVDNRLQLPASPFSYVLQDWDQALCVEQAFSQASQTIARILGLKQSVDSLEHMNAAMAERVAFFRENRPQPAPAAEGALVVGSADGKGIVLRRDSTAPPPAAHRTKGEKASRKQMAIVGTVYTVDRYVRSPEEVVAALFRERPESPPPERPLPLNKHVWASLARVDADGVVHSGLEVVYPWMLNEVAERNPGMAKETVYLHDGQEALWEARAKYLPQRNSTDILDLLHVTPRLWQAAHVFHRERSNEAEAFVRERLLRVLRGEVGLVIRGLREMATKRALIGAKKKTLTTICGYLAKNQQRMRYADYLAKGYPIASGVIEGACRHLVKDRMERAGMHWTPPGAQAMLDVRSTYVNGDWETYQAHRIEREGHKLYPYRELVEGEIYQMAA
jgi:hypothetical protein